MRKFVIMSAETCLGKILHNEEEHVDYIETQFELIERIGIESYTHLQSEANAH